jgi:hypothetical protein
MLLVVLSFSAVRSGAALAADTPPVPHASVSVLPDKRTFVVEGKIANSTLKQKLIHVSSAQKKSVC